MTVDDLAHLILDEDPPGALHALLDRVGTATRQELEDFGRLLGHALNDLEDLDNAIVARVDRLSGDDA